MEHSGYANVAKSAGGETSALELLSHDVFELGKTLERIMARVQDKADLIHGTHPKAASGSTEPSPPIGLRSALERQVKLAMAIESAVQAL